MQSEPGPNPTEPDPRSRTAFQHPIGLLGTALALVAFSAGVVLVLLDWWLNQSNPYLGVVTYLVIPGVVAFGLILIGVGVWLERRRRRRTEPQTIGPWVIDLNWPAHRRVLWWLLSGGTILVLSASIVGYRAYEFTESVAFCGQVCHTVMNPERTAYLESPHARVRCTECHVGPGVGSYARGKLAGVGRVFAVLGNSYRRPIPTPLENLRPARDLCEQCHWPSQAYGSMERDYRHFLSDERNTPWRIHLLVDVGGGNPRVGEPRGIHWHMSLTRSVYYAATDGQRQDIPWVKTVDAQGNERVFVKEGSSFSADSEPLRPRLMDCLDCHNRPAHVFDSPVHAVERAMAEGTIPVSLPYIKQKAVEALSREYPSKEAALRLIGDSLAASYQGSRPELEGATAAVRRIYQQNFFPEMGVTWKVHPSNIGHLTSPGCFRCHDGLHRSPDGRVISKGCATCHAIIEQGPDGARETSLRGMEFRHPADIGDVWKETPCSDCHTGGSG